MINVRLYTVLDKPDIIWLDDYQFSTVRQISKIFIEIAIIEKLY